MCRLAAYIGPVLRLEELLLKPDHSLVKQSWAPREMMEARLNADGYGFGWFDHTGRPLRYRQTMPIWTDPNLAELGRGLEADTLVLCRMPGTRMRGSGVKQAIDCRMNMNGRPR